MVYRKPKCGGLLLGEVRARAREAGLAQSNAMNMGSKPLKRTTFYPVYFRTVRTGGLKKTVS